MVLGMDYDCVRVFGQGFHNKCMCIKFKAVLSRK